MLFTYRLHAIVEIVIVGTGVVMAAPMAPDPVAGWSVRLTGIDTAASPLGDGTALVYDGSGGPVPPPQTVDAADNLYLQPLGFTGTPQSSFIPDGLYPFSGIKSLELGPSLAQGQQIMLSDIEDRIAAGGVSPENPVVVFGYSQSAIVATLIMPQLQAAGVPSDDVHFVLVGDETNPNGGYESMFDIPPGTTSAFAAFGVPFEPPAPSDLYPTDIYTIEYDGGPDFPRFTTNLLSDLNAYFGVFLGHTFYEDLPADQINNAILLPGSEALTGEGLTNYYMIPNDNLPLLEPLLLIPGIGKPLYDLLEPATRIEVNLGYGSITEGWNQGPANVPTNFGLFPQVDQTQLSDAMSNAWQQGVTGALHDLQNPISYQDQVAPLQPFVDFTYTHGFAPADPSFTEFLNGFLKFVGFPVSDVTPSSAPTDIVNALTATLSYDYSALLPAADSINTLLTSLPAYDANIFTDQLDAGNLLNAILDPLSANTALVSYDLIIGVAPALFAGLGTVMNLTDLFS
ncbi:PE-PPE domain-containing protein [[Mycobacterium] crassicus]|uniref:PE-PPE domain-containing protein n=1 Tax=[Mycobacterium] crassicus TaxID=2872309 RepID=A0ABU5XLE2_9MYCO|nr:PE-PPE domain-containing protein [Mycolicibacter sp. MYC098]MEB3023105.1 PE-PPE domain-containing protein [Mycolicibacter sp. MYC098]